jgi:hypothetical protein
VALERAQEDERQDPRRSSSTARSLSQDSRFLQALHPTSRQHLDGVFVLKDEQSDKKSTRER